MIDDRWGEMGSWTDGELRREAFFFSSGGTSLFGSLYAASRPTQAGGMVICNSWGYEANQATEAIHALALAAASAGGAGLVFHYPGFGDSQGESGDVAMETLDNAAVDALAAAAARVPTGTWTLAGLMLGAAVAARAAARVDVDRLLLIQPQLEVSRYFDRLERSARRAAARVPARAGNAYGYPLPRRILAAGGEIDAGVGNALWGFAGHGAVVRYAEPEYGDAIPPLFEDVVVPGAWRFGAQQKPDLVTAATDWLRASGGERRG